LEITLTLEHPESSPELFGPADVNLKYIRQICGVQITARDSRIRFSGQEQAVSKAATIFKLMQVKQQAGDRLNKKDLAQIVHEASQEFEQQQDSQLTVFVPGRNIQPRTQGQEYYVEAIGKNDLVFCLGPAGTGKTYLAVAMAVAMLKRNEIRRIVLARPAVEAGEKLGFLPGDLQAKVNPYLRPLFDALGDMMEYAQVKRFVFNDIIEVIPLAFMRGRTFNDALVILDEAQNTTVSQMLMFLTRMGRNTKMIVTGDDSQTDLEKHQQSGLTDAVGRLRGIKGIGIVKLQEADIVRHRLVQNIVKAYDTRNGDSTEASADAVPSGQ